MNPTEYFRTVKENLPSGVDEFTRELIASQMIYSEHPEHSPVHMYIMVPSEEFAAELVGSLKEIFQHSSFIRQGVIEQVDEVEEPNQIIQYLDYTNSVSKSNFSTLYSRSNLDYPVTGHLPEEVPLLTISAPKSGLIDDHMLLVDQDPLDLSILRQYDFVHYMKSTSDKERSYKSEHNFVRGLNSESISVEIDEEIENEFISTYMDKAGDSRSLFPTGSSQLSKIYNLVTYRNQLISNEVISYITIEDIVEYNWDSLGIISITEFDAEDLMSPNTFSQRDRKEYIIDLIETSEGGLTKQELSTILTILGFTEEKVRQDIRKLSRDGELYQIEITDEGDSVYGVV